MKSNRFWQIAEKIFWTLCSLKLAVLIILTITVLLATATVLESVYDTKTAQYWIYQSLIFHLALAFLGINIFSVAVSRYPWTWRHVPFLLAHLGILVLLVGSWITDQKAIDGSIRISEGQTSSVVELDSTSLVMSAQDKIFSYPIRWQPPGTSFRPFKVQPPFDPSFTLVIDQFLPHADPEVSFTAVSEESLKTRDQKALRVAPALHLQLVGGPMRVTQKVWLWGGAMDWSALQAGPAFFYLGALHPANSALKRPELGFEILPKGGLAYRAQSSDGHVVSGRWEKNAIQGAKLQPGWKGDFQVTVLEWIPAAEMKAVYQPSRIQYGPQAPPSAIHLSAEGSQGVWLGLGDRTTLHLEGQEVELGYFSRRVILPFAVRLEKFQIDHDPGTLRAAAYSSDVSVIQENQESRATISMNEPLTMKDFTLYQASYEEAEPRPVTSIFSVNHDPGRVWKYSGSFLIVLGSVLLAAVKYRKKKQGV